jgi:hypothetical protein
MVGRVFALKDDRAMAKGRDQLSVKFDPDLMAAIERAAAQEHRTVSAQVRHYAAQAIEEQGARRDPPRDGGRMNASAA